jgi:cytoskeleton-associated protein 5
VDGVARPEQIEFLHQQMMPHFSSAIMELLFSTDHHSDRDYLTALTILDTCLLEQPSEVAYDASWHDFKPRWIANLDLLFKYLTVRLSDSATTIVFKCLDFADHLMAVLSAESYFLSDYEANCCMPALVAKVRQNTTNLTRLIDAVGRPKGGPPSARPKSRQIHSDHLPG